MTYTLGIDIGTTSICALARNTETGKPELVLNRPNRASLPAPVPYARLQNPDILLETVRELLAEATESLGRPAAIGFSGQLHGILCLERDGILIWKGLPSIRIRRILSLRWLLFYNDSVKQDFLHRYELKASFL